MTPYAAIDLRGGRVVQLVGGRPEDERVSLPDPVSVARRWVDAGFRDLHVVDLDAALDTGSNRGSVLRIIDETPEARIQVGGGVRDDEAIGDLVAAGAERVVVGTRAIEDPMWLTRQAERYDGRVVVAVDLRDGEVMTRGWTERAAISAVEFLPRLDTVPLAAVLVTDVSREGRMTGADVERFGTLAGATRHPMLASGGIRSIDDLRALAEHGLSGAVLGMALYTETIDAHDVTREFE